MLPRFVSSNSQASTAAPTFVFVPSAHSAVKIFSSPLASKSVYSLLSSVYYMPGSRLVPRSITRKLFLCSVLPLSNGRRAPGEVAFFETVDVPFVTERDLNTSPRPHSPPWERILLLIFVLSLPLLNPWVRGDGVGYYAFARAPLIEHSLDFQHDYLFANDSFRQGRIDPNGEIDPHYRTVTGHLDNHFTVGPALLWAPFLLIAHGAVLLARALGSHIAADGFSVPYRIAMAVGTGVYGFLGLLLSFRLARNYVADRWAFLATLAIWWASSLPVYMYFNPSWSHAHSAFAVSLFLWYWHKTRPHRDLRQWCILAAITGLMLNVYYANAMLLVVLVPEALGQYFPREPRVPAYPSRFSLFAKHLAFVAVSMLCLLPTLITRSIVYGGPFQSGYIPLKYWLWRSPVFLQVLFSSDHGLLAWTPVIVLSLAGLVLFARREPGVGGSFLAATVAFYLFISCYPDWAGISSYGNRFFVSLTPIFIVGLAVLLDHVSSLFRAPRAATLASSSILACFVLWNLGFIFQWGTHLVPARGPISWRQMIRNQFILVPQQIAARGEKYLFRRNDLMRQIEQQDLQQQQEQQDHPQP